MAEISYMYSKIRKEFGRPCEFQPSEPEDLTNHMPNDTIQQGYTYLDPMEREIENIPTLSEAWTNTTQIEMKPRGQTHVEGGWPLQVDYTELDDKTKFRKKVEREEGYYQTCKRLVDEHAEKVLKQNNAIDIFESYFVGDELDLSSGPPSAKTVTVFQDPSPVKRTVSKISWLPDGKKLAIAYCNMKFQAPCPPEMSTKSHVWDVNNPNSPELDLITQSPLCCLQYSPKDTNLIAGGSYNGVVQLWDVRKATAAAGSEVKTAKSDKENRSIIDDSHKDPVWDLKWLMSKSGEFLTVSTDGRAFIWDVRALSQPVPAETVTLKPADKINDGGPKGELGGICIDYDAQVGGPSKYMVGTEQGTVLLCNRKGKTPQDKIANCYNGHHGPVYSVMRNPHCSKYFLTIGDWTGRLWVAEDAQLRTPMFQTYYHNAYLTGGTWHPSRPGVFLTTRMDGVMNVWDLLYRQSAPVLSVQVSDFSLNTIQCTNEGKHVAVGGVDGQTVLLELSQGLCNQQNDEKNIIETMFLRESSRDRSLVQRAKERKQKGKRKSVNQERKGQEGQGPDEGNLKDMAEKFLGQVHDQEEKDKKEQEELLEKRRVLIEQIEGGQEVQDED